ncbi:MAG: rhomboid family intramembrane serine protease [Candidatus Micrarchaeota archaeon]|nr:rhomboid family intramembrane serine protease [Candidatus Micrarchaeota archaeon]
MRYGSSYYRNDYQASFQYLVGLIFIIFLLQILIPNFTKIFMLVPTNLQPWQLVSSIFLHGGFLHLFLNLYALYFFGQYLETIIGTKRFLLIFFLSGIAGNLLYLFTIYLNIIPPVPALGASGAIYGILGALAVLSPNLTILLFGLIPLKMREAAILWFVLEFIGSFDISSGVGSAAHLGGLVVGYLIAKNIGFLNFGDEKHLWQ